ncbi:hypothetical protein JM84_0065 [Dokdonia sp. Hel_I_63]|uniref:hypothetical protein n=1 Tax=unclassified Dokdonia TaxID=2615033 RepID=UPI00020A6A0F|nr:MULTISPECIES: hypothetical protein [unclassified Dokdonia]AEE19574.1 hypothetical protein Krodi_1591 [Dokdonia sp. 4H-3-7-5]TVZ21198.1 hypothetical protein JM84_0065 [Dokdonia sp. Hel_I_63]
MAVFCLLSPIKKVVFQLAHNIEHAIVQDNNHNPPHQHATITTHHHSNEVSTHHSHRALTFLKLVFNSNDQQPEHFKSDEKYNTDKQLSQTYYPTLASTTSTDTVHNWWYLEKKYSSQRDLFKQPPQL